MKKYVEYLLNRLKNIGFIIIGENDDEIKLTYLSYTFIIIKDYSTRLPSLHIKLRNEDIEKEYPPNVKTYKASYSFHKGRKYVSIIINTSLYFKDNFVDLHAIIDYNNYKSIIEKIDNLFITDLRDNQINKVLYG